ncbi:CGNR zinc finger domain-containing protein [Edaphobacter bradus]|uniref:CGNR zinc finger domain-containing protein n=1 Tax=Edaphobacter bradus TaxID=2259016 RepID=UPI0021E005D0|nr:ABATE domain-containing protein [Edaphobacter bradus]
MKNTLLKAPTNEDHLDFVGDDLAINFINTRRIVEGQLTDTLQSDSDVKAWLRRLEVPVAKRSLPFGDGVLLKGARELRDIALAAFQDRKSGKKPSLVALNRFLADAPSHAVLTIYDARNIRVTRVYGKETVEAFLAPVAEAVADLLADGDFELVRHCEGRDCVMWFYDRTKGHRRRWCTSTGCGNRAKVAAFRARASQQ